VSTRFHHVKCTSTERCLLIGICLSSVSRKLAVPAIPTNFTPRPTAINGQGSLCLTTVNEKLDAVNSNSLNMPATSSCSQFLELSQIYLFVSIHRREPVLKYPSKHKGKKTLANTSIRHSGISLIYIRGNSYHSTSKYNGRIGRGRTQRENITVIVIAFI